MTRLWRQRPKDLLKSCAEISPNHRFRLRLPWQLTHQTSDEVESDDESSTSKAEPFYGKVYHRTLQALANQGFIHVLTSKGVPSDAKVIRVKFTANMAPHPAFVTVKGINAVVNLNNMKRMIKGLRFSPTKAAIAILGCVSIEGPQTACGLCHFHFASVWTGGYDNLADFFAPSDEDDDDDSGFHSAHVDEYLESSELQGDSGLSDSSQKGCVGTGSPTRPGQFTRGRGYWVQALKPRMLHCKEGSGAPDGRRCSGGAWGEPGLCIIFLTTSGIDGDPESATIGTYCQGTSRL